LAHVGNRTNQYQTLAGYDLFEDIPKSVWAAIACGFYFNRMEDGSPSVREEIIREWSALKEAGIVPQAVPAKYLAELPTT